MGSAKRNNEIVKAGRVNILANVALCSAKMILGFITGSLVVIIDGINNLTDVLSSVITIIGTKLSDRPANDRHPYGYGRIEYITALLVGLIISFTAISAIKDSILAIFNPVERNIDSITLTVMGLAVAVKLALGIYMRKKGKDINASIIIGIGTDALTDALVTTVALISIFVEYSFGLSVEGPTGVILSALLLKVGIGLCAEAVNELIGNRLDNSLAKQIKKFIIKYDDVYGVHKVVLHQYGTGKICGSAWIAVSTDMNIANLYNLSMQISEDVREEYGIDLTISPLPFNDCPDEDVVKVHDRAIEISQSYSLISRILSPFKNPDNPNIMDITIEQKMNQNPKEVAKLFEQDLINEFPGREFRIHWTFNLSE